MGTEEEKPVPDHLTTNMSVFIHCFIEDIIMYSASQTNKVTLFWKERQSCIEASIVSWEVTDVACVFCLPTMNADNRHHNMDGGNEDFFHWCKDTIRACGRQLSRIHVVQ